MQIRVSDAQRAAFAHDRHLAVTANAGAGKTSVLSLRVLWLAVEHAVPIDRIIAITFTTKAAAEMRERIRALIQVMLADERERQTMLFTVRDEIVLQRLHTVRQNLGDARISTFHSFCSGILRQFGHLEGVDPESTELSPREARALQARAVRKAIQEFQEQHPDHAAAVYEHIDFSTFEDVLRSLVTSPERLRMLDQRKVDADVDRVLPALQQRSLQILKEIPMNLLRQALLGWDQCYRSEQPSSAALAYRDRLESLLHAIASGEHASSSMFEDTWKELSLVYTKSGTVLKRGAPKDIDLSTAPALDKSEVELLHVFGKGLSDNHDRDSLYVANQAMAVAFRAAEEYQRDKRRQHRIDFDDMMAGVVDLLTRHPQIARAIARSVDYVLVDEYQDTNPTQYELVKLLVPSIAHPDQPAESKLFIVGDTKQSIYGFRDADVRLFETTVTTMHASNQTSGVTGPTEFILDTSYRMAAPLAQSINDLCQKIFVEDSEFDVGYTPLVSGRTNNADTSVGTLTTLISEMTSDEEEEANDEELTSSEIEVRNVAAYIAQLLHDGLVQVVDKGQARSLRPGDIGILARRTRVVTMLARELHALNVPFEIYGGRAFFSRPEVADLRNLLTAAILPAARPALAAVLRSPIFRCTDADLAAIALRASDRTLQWDALQTLATSGNASEALLQAYQQLVALQHQLTSQPPVAALRHVLLASGWYDTLADEPRREQVLANVEKVFSLIDDVSSRAGATLFDVLEAIAAPEDRDDEAEQSFSVDPDVVKVMTIHASKGLEFGVTVLCDLGDARSSSNYSLSDQLGLTIALGRHTATIQKPSSEERPLGMLAQAQARLRRKQEEAENRRLLYVALTRAKDHVIVSLQRRYNKVDKKTGERPLRAMSGLAKLVSPFLFFNDAQYPEVVPPTESIRYRGTRDATHNRIDRSDPLVPSSRPLVVRVTSLLSPDCMPPSESDGAVMQGADQHGALIGTVVHRAIELLVPRATPTPDELQEALTTALQSVESDLREDALRTSITAQARRHVDAITASDVWREVQSLDTEVEVGAVIDDVLVYGRVDGLQIQHDGTVEHAIVWDWKTNDVQPHTVGSIAQHYQVQLDAYAWILLQRPTLHSVTTRLVFTAMLNTSPQDAIVERTYDRESLAGLTITIRQGIEALTNDNER